ncbi:MAG: hypothetical protein GY810_14525 [Aureispira sp.]|nr:hypothetical protein [Aureispira sp.]
MYRLLLLIGCLSCLISTSTLQAQKMPKLDKLTVRVGPIGSLGWNLYHWYQRPINHEFSKVSGHRSAGQILNVMPSFSLGILMCIDTKTIHQGLAWYNEYYLSIEGGVSYMPFSYDFDERKGQSALAFPVSLNFYVPVGGIGLSFGAGAQFSRMEFNRNTVVYEDLKNPFFVTYFAEVGIIPHEFDMSYSFLLGANFFARVGLGEYQTITADFGIRGIIGYTH